MDVLDYCHLNHLRDDINDTDLHLRLCRFCRKAMCEACFGVHKNHCSGQTQSSKRIANNVASTCEGPGIKKSKTYQPLEKGEACHVLPTYRLSSNPSPKTHNLHTYASCSVHSFLEDQFCISHCQLVCQQCHTEHHTTCTVKSVQVVCQCLDDSIVTEYRKWLNNLRVNCIELKKMLSRNLDSVEKSKISSLDYLQTKFSQANENLNIAFRDTKSDIVQSFDTHFSEMWQKISQIDEINAKLENSLRDSGLLEGNRTDVKLFLKLVNTICKYNNKALSDDIKTLCDRTKNVKYSFVANSRYQPLSSRSKLGHVNKVVTRFTNINPVSTIDLSHIFTKPSNGQSACLSTRSENVHSRKTKEHQTTLISGETAESVHVASDSDKLESLTMIKDFSAKATGQYVHGYMYETKQNNGQNDGNEHINLNENQNVNTFCKKQSSFPKMSRIDPENIPKTVRESSTCKQNLSTKIIQIQTPTEQNKTNVVILHGSPHALVPYNTVSPFERKDGNKLDGHELAVESGYGRGSMGATNDEPAHIISEQTKLPGNNYKNNDQTLLFPKQPSAEKGSDIHINMAGCRNAQAATSAETSFRYTDSYELEPHVPTMKMNENDNEIIQPNFTSNIAECSRQPENNTESDNVNFIKGNSAIRAKVIASTHGTDHHVSMATYQLHRKNVSSLNTVVTRNQEMNLDQQHNGPSGILSPLRQTEGIPNITSNNNRQQYEDSKLLKPSTSKVGFSENDYCIHPDSNIHLSGDFRSDCYNNFNDALFSNNPSCLPTLPGSTNTTTAVWSNTMATTLSDKSCEIGNDKRMLFTKLKVKSVSKKYVRLSTDIKLPTISGCVFMPDERVVLLDYENINLKLLDKSFTLEDSLELPCSPWDISVVNDTTVIITLPYKEQLQYIEVLPRLKSVRVLQLDKKCRGVHVVGSDTYVTCTCTSRFSRYGEVRILDKNGDLINSLDMNMNNKFMLYHPDYLAVSARSGKIYVSDTGTDTVTCLTSDGTVVFKYKDPELRAPSGLCVDDEDNVMVCGNESHNIHIVTAAGKKSSIILTKNDGIKDRISVAYRRSDHTLIFGCYFNSSLFVINCAEK